MNCANRQRYILFKRKKYKSTLGPFENACIVAMCNWGLSWIIKLEIHKISRFLPFCESKIQNFSETLRNFPQKRSAQICKILQTDKRNYLNTEKKFGQVFPAQFCFSRNCENSEQWNYVMSSISWLKTSLISIEKKTK